MNQKYIDAVKVLQDNSSKDESKEAFETLYNEFSKSAYFLALKLMKNPQSAEDITQEVFIKVFQKIGELKDPLAFPAWFKRIVVNQCTYALKQDNKLPIADLSEEETNLEFIEETNDSLIPDKSLDNAETARLIVGIIDTLPTPQKVCVLYYYYEQLSIAEIAENLAVSENTVKTRLSLARQKIGKELKKLEEKDGIKLYSIAPFIVPALHQIMTETEVPAHLFSNITAEIAVLSATAATATTAAVMTLKTKILIATGGVAVVGGIIAGVIISDLDDENEFEEAYNPSIITTTVSTTVFAEATTTLGYTTQPPETVSALTDDETVPPEATPTHSETVDTIPQATAQTRTRHRVLR